jgi:hypothetical protein
MDTKDLPLLSLTVHVFTNQILPRDWITEKLKAESVIQPLHSILYQSEKGFRILIDYSCESRVEKSAHFATLAHEVIPGLKGQNEQKCSVPTFTLLTLDLHYSFGSIHSGSIHSGSIHIACYLRQGQQLPSQLTFSSHKVFKTLWD